MSFFDDPQDAADAFEVVLTEEEKQQRQVENDWIVAELDSITTDKDNGGEPFQEHAKEKRTIHGVTFQAPNPDDEDVIIEPVRQTRYDKARSRLRELEAKREAILAQSETCDEDKMRLLELSKNIRTAKERFDKASERAKIDIARRQESIDEWRKTDAGKAIYNASRRKVRDQPNNDLSHMQNDPVKLAQYRRDKRSDANWIKRRRDKGIPEQDIRAEYVLRLEERQRKRGLEELPNFGLF